MNCIYCAHGRCLASDNWTDNCIGATKCNMYKPEEEYENEVDED